MKLILIIALGILVGLYFADFSPKKIFVSNLKTEDYYLEKCYNEAIEMKLVKPGFEIVAKWDCMMIANRACIINGCKQ